MKSRRWITGIKKLAACVIMVLAVPVFADKQVFKTITRETMHCQIEIKGNNPIYCNGSTVNTSEDSLSLEVSGTISSRSGSGGGPIPYMAVTVVDSENKSRSLSSLPSDNYYTVWVYVYTVYAPGGSPTHQLSERFPFTLHIIKDTDSPEFANEEVFQFVGDKDNRVYCLIKTRGNGPIYCTGSTVYTSEDSLSLAVSGSMNSRSGSGGGPIPYMSVSVVDSTNTSTSRDSLASGNYYTVWVNLYTIVTPGGSPTHQLSERYSFTLNIKKDTNGPEIKLL